jgi:hypothetical protein
MMIRLFGISSLLLELEIRKISKTLKSTLYL